MSTFLKVTGSILVAASVGYAAYTATKARQEARRANERVEALADEVEGVVETAEHLKAKLNKKAPPRKEAAHA